MNLANLAQYGVAIFSIAAIIYTVHLFVGVVKNHLTHSTETNGKLANAIENMLRFLEKK